MKRTQVYPFSAIVGQKDMKLALLLNVVNPALGGVLVKGEKGTAKSTAVRALAALLPAVEMAAGCPFHCDPTDAGRLCDACAAKLAKNGALSGVSGFMRVVELPVSATEDRVVGTLDMEYAIKEGEKKFEPGILAEANRNILYVDEINLLDDHVVDVLLDAAAMGVNTVEREGVSYSHPARFVLVGTMNPEEGDIRPQLLDRFALSVEVAGENEASSRVEVIKRRMAYEAGPREFRGAWEAAEEELARKITAARKLLPQVAIEDELLLRVAEASLKLGVDGHRADITVIKTALTLAALEERKEATLPDVRRAASLALPHRMRRRPFEEASLSVQVLDELFGAAEENGTCAAAE